MRETIGQRLRRLRKSALLTQQALADLVGLRQSAVGNIESGIRQYGGSVVDFARVLNVTPAYLKCETDSPATPPMQPAGGALPVPAPLGQTLLGIEAQVQALAPVLQGSGRDTLARWARGELSADQAAQTIAALAQASRALPTQAATVESLDLRKLAAKP